ncbi:hypothetical protein KZZ07_00635 [Mameliella sp. CS4]|uniref:hypothetical protein n=1 Tax=Mameliella sp. CS4 TaxID=2862329 RepID=UPI001C5D15BE|nr:hypothetical protein [Mameliella sp. CS4]MBW4981033.1 hypothetical protein [Mameliella sp. CS4]
MDKLDILSLQKVQYAHDKRNHSDILSLHKNDRSKHYGLHFAKYSARLATGYCKKKSTLDTAVDSILVSLSSANTLMLELDFSNCSGFDWADLIRQYTIEMAKYCDGCEKIDHAEEFWPLLREANLNIFSISFEMASRNSNNVLGDLAHRRHALAKRQFYIGAE